MRADLHIHTTYSDGELSPTSVVKSAIKYGLDIVAITDHDTTEGIDEAKNQTQGSKLAVIGGVELSAFDETEVHILGYNASWGSKSLQNDLLFARSLRAERNEQMLKKLNSLGIQISLEDIIQFLPNATVGNIGRSHIAKALVAKGYSDSITDAFEIYLKNGAQAYVSACRLTSYQALELINKNNGISVLAHPLSINLNNEDLDYFIKKLVDNGLKGIEANYFSHTNLEKANLTKIARKYNLLTTGGSDFHNVARGGVMGEKYYYISDEMGAALKK